MRFRKTGIGYLWLGLIFALFMIAVSFIAGLVTVPLGIGLNTVGAAPAWLLILAIIMGLMVLGYALHWFVERNQFDKGKSRWY